MSSKFQLPARYTLDGYPVIEGDTVHDVVMGSGVVEVSTQESITVYYGTQRITYLTGGKGPWPMRTLFWRNPILVTPSKNDDLWSLQTELCRNLCKLMNEQMRRVTSGT